MNKIQKIFNFSLSTFNLRCQPNGFTLIEMIVVVFIIGILAASVITISTKSQKQARDAKRKADLQLLSSSLEMYYLQNKAYPIQSGLAESISNSCAWRTDFMQSSLMPSYIQELPKDPLKRDTSVSCLSTDTGNFYYYYKATGSGSAYVLCAALENASDPDKNAVVGANSCPSGGMFTNGYMIKSQ